MDSQELPAQRGPWGGQVSQASKVFLEIEGTLVTQVSLALWA